MCMCACSFLFSIVSVCVCAWVCVLFYISVQSSASKALRSRVCWEDSDSADEDVLLAAAMVRLPSVRCDQSMALGNLSPTASPPFWPPAFLMSGCEQTCM